MKDFLIFTAFEKYGSNNLLLLLLINQTEMLRPPNFFRARKTFASISLKNHYKNSRLLHPIFD